jgi:2-oxoglutarate ferredoxin oxidoreductase subunit alpha
MQLTGDRFTTSSALLGNDMSTFPDFPAEIRAPAGTLNGVSAFQVHISDHDILTPGDAPDVLVAMNPAALKANIDLMDKGTIILVNSDAFEERNLAKAGYAENPLTDGSLGAYTVYEVPMTSITQEVCKEAGVKPRDAERSKNFFALGLVSWLYTRPIEPTLAWITERFGAKPQVAEARRRSSSSPTTRSAHPRSSRASTSRSRATRPWPGASSRRPGWPASRSSWAATRSRRPPTSCTS